MSTLPRLWHVGLLAIAGMWAWPASGDAAEPAPPALDKIVCKVNGAEIRELEVRAALQELLPRFTFHASVSPEARRQLSRQALQNVIDSELAYQDARRRELEVDDQALADAVQAVRDRYPDEAAFRRSLRAAGIGLDSLKRNLARQPLSAQVEELVGGPERPASVAEARHYYERNPSRFQQPRQASLRYVLVKVPPVPRTPEGWAAAEALALKARTRLEAGKPIDRIVGEISTPEWTATGGELGTVHEGQLQAELDALVWALPEGGISKPVRAFEGVYIVQVQAFLPPRLVPFEEIQDKLRVQLGASQRRERVERWRQRLREEAHIEILDAYYADLLGPV